MSFSEKLMEQGSKPSGLLGRLAGNLMNLGHKSIHHWGLSGISSSNVTTALDVGCGGGKVIKLLAQKLPGGKVYGIDHSVEMVKLSKQVNRSFIESQRVEIEHGSVSTLPYAGAMFDIVTAFETIQFWPDLDGDLLEVKRVLKPSGKLLIVNRFPDLTGKNADWADVLQIHSAAEYQERLNTAGYVSIVIDDTSKPGWIMVTARKP